MIKYVKRKDLDIDKYNACVENSVQSRIYAFSWYLDIAVDNWDALVLDNYKAVMPIPWRKKYFIKYVYLPRWTLQLGIFSIDTNLKIDIFLDYIFQNFKFVELRMNTNNFFKNNPTKRITRKMQLLSLIDGYNTIYSNYRKDRKKDLQKANKNHLTAKWGDTPNNLITLFKNNVATKMKKLPQKDYDSLLKIITICNDKNIGEILSIYNDNEVLVGAVFLLKHKKTVTKVVSSTDLKERNKGVNTFMIDKIINKYQTNFDIFDFGGSSIDSIAKFSRSFNAVDVEYDLIKHNNLPMMFKVFKQ